MRTTIHVIISKMLIIGAGQNWPKVRVVLVTKNKTRLGMFRWNSWGDVPYFCVSAHLHPHLYLRFHPDPFRFGGERQPKNLCTTPIVNTISAKINYVCVILFMLILD